MVIGKLYTRDYYTLCRFFNKRTQYFNFPILSESCPYIDIGYYIGHEVDNFGNL